MRKEAGRRLLIGGGAGLVGGMLLDKMGVAHAQEAEKGPAKELEDYDNMALMYHEVSYAQLKGDIDWHLNNGFQPISLETMVKGIRKEVHVSKDLKVFHPTFDDGLKSQMAALQVLHDIQQERKGLYVPMTFFIPMQFNIKAEGVHMQEIPPNDFVYYEGIKSHNYMTLADLLELRKNGCRIENHTANHGDLPSLPLDKWHAEIHTGGERIQQVLDMTGKPQEYKAFVYPNGHFTQGIVQYVKDEGYDIGFGTDITTAASALRHLTLLRVRKS